MTRRFVWIFCCVIGCAPTLLMAQQADVTSGAAGSCDSGWACNPAWVELANLSYPLRRLNVSSGCGGGQSTLFCLPSQDIYTPLCETPCDNNTAAQCTGGQHSPDNMLDYVGSFDPDYLTYWQSENTVTAQGDGPIQQYVEVSVLSCRYIH